MSAPGPWVAVFFDLEHVLVSRGQWQPGARACLQRLGDSGLRLGLICNTGTVSRRELAATLPPGFDFNLFEAALVVLSSEVGVEKPDARIFAVALSRAQAAPERTVFVGYDPVELLAAQRIGMRSLRVVCVPDDFDVLVASALGTSD